MYRKLALMVIVFSTIGAPALADIGPIGDPVEGNSWLQCWGVGSTVDLFGIKYVSGPGGPLEAPIVLSDFEIETQDYVDWGLPTKTPDSEWQQLMATSTIASAVGPARFDPDSENLWVHFAGNMSSPITVQMFGFNGDSMVYGSTLYWSGTKWSYQGSATATRAEFTPAVPAPGAALLIGLGLGLVGWLKRRIA